MSLTMVGVGHAEDGGTLGKENYTLVLNTKGQSNAEKVLKVSHLSLGDTVAYCVDLDNPNDRGDAYKSKEIGEDESGKLAAVEAILSHGYGILGADDLLKAAGVTKPEGFTDADAKVAAYTGTQAAIWNTLFPNRFALPAGDPTEQQVDLVATIAGDATWYDGGAGREFSAKWWSPQFKVIQKVYKYLLAGEFAKPTLAITPATATANVGSKAGPFTVKITGGASDAKLTGSEGTSLVGADGKPITEAADKTEFFVDCKAVGTFTVTAKSTYVVAKAKFWVGKDKKIQKLVTPVKDEKELTATATATCTAAPGLPVTGAPVVGTVGAGLGLVVVGAGLFLMRRRRRIRFTA